MRITSKCDVPDILTHWSRNSVTDEPVTGLESLMFVQHNGRTRTGLNFQ